KLDAKLKRRDFLAATFRAVAELPGPLPQHRHGFTGYFCEAPVHVGEYASRKGCRCARYLPAAPTLLVVIGSRTCATLTVCTARFCRCGVKVALSGSSPTCARIFVIQGCGSATSVS